MRMSEKCRKHNNSDNPLVARRTNGGKNSYQLQFANIFLPLLSELLIMICMYSPNWNVSADLFKQCKESRLRKELVYDLN